MSEPFRCFGDTPIYIEYHDHEWGRPVHDDQRLFEMLILEGAQAGLSWITLLKKREAYRAAFDGFDPAKVALYDNAKIAELPITTPISDQISKDLKKMGFKFVGSTIIYSFMQAVGMVNDHLKSCCVYEDTLHANLS